MAERRATAAQLRALQAVADRRVSYDQWNATFVGWRDDVMRRLHLRGLVGIAYATKSGMEKAIVPVFLRGSGADALGAETVPAGRGR